MAYYNQDANAVLHELQSSAEHGINSLEAKRRLATHGPNELVEKKKINPVVLFLNQFNNFIVYILIAAIIVSLIAEFYEGTRNFTDAIVISIILIFNAVFGFIQEYRAEKAISALKKLTALQATVIRDGKEQTIPTRELVCGDIIILSEGSKIPADARIIDSKRAQVAEATLTGESVPVTKSSATLSGTMQLGDRVNMVFSGTDVVKGRIVAVVVATGMKTEIGSIAKMIDDAGEEMTPLQIKLKQLGKWLVTATLIICAIIFGLEMLEGATSGFIEAFIVAVSLAVAAVPEGLPAVVTISLALGVRRMVKKHALIRRLPAVETLGGTTVICSDKTGTLTKNEMTVRRIYCDGMDVHVSGEGYNPDGDFLLDGKEVDGKKLETLLRIGALCNDSRLEHENEAFHIMGDPTEGALVVSAEKAEIHVDDLRAA
ncbi:MAG: HAD-IC family P-type ATPase, partial [Nanoarchaeota archaeon]